MSKRFNKNIPYTFTGGINLSTSANLVSVHNSNTIANIITTGGNVGIGTTSPGSALHVTGTIGAIPIGTGVHMGTDSVNNASIIQINQGGSTSGTAIMDFGYSGVNYVSRIIHDNNTKNLTILVNGGASSVTFQSSGNVGIGTNSPAYTLDVTGSLRSTGDIFIGNGTAAEALNLWDIPGAAWQLSTGGYNLSIRNGTVGSTMVDRVTIASTGNVGIGITAPSSRLHVVMGDATSAGSTALWDSTYSVFGQSSNTGGAVGIGYNSASGGCLVSLSPNVAWQPMTYRGANHQFVISGTVNTPPSMILNSSGNLGIGTTSPGTILDIVSSTPIITIRESTNASGKIYFGNSSHGVGRNASIGALTNGNDVTLWTNGVGGSVGFATQLTERMRITDGGSVGIGTSSPQATLHVGTGQLQLGASNTAGVHMLASNSGLAVWRGTWGAGIVAFCSDSRGNFGIGTHTPAFTLDVNGTIARSGVKLPRYDNGSFSGSASFSIPILFNDTQYNYAEFRVRYITSAICNMNISATSYASVAMNFSECALTTVKWNAQGTPVYATFSNVTSGIFADTVEMVGIDNNLIFRITRATGTSSAGLRNQYSYDNVYCWSGVGTARGYGQGWISNGTVGGSPLQFVTFTCSTGTVSGTYSTVHYY